MHLVQGLEVGGLEIMVVNLLEHLDHARYRPAVCCYDTPGSLAGRLCAQGIAVTLVKRNPGIDLFYILKLARFLRRSKTRILHLHNSTALFYGTLAGKLAGTPCIVYTEHGRDFSSSRKAKFANGLLSRMVDKVVVVAESCKNYLVAKEGVAAEHVVTVPNGIDASRFGVDYDKAAIRAALGLEERHAVIGVVARLDPIKNHAALIRAMQRVAAKLPQAVLLVVGDGPLRGELESLAAELELGGHVRFLGARADVPELLSILDVFVLPSHSEGLSLTLLEASAAAKPIVATDVGGNGEVVTNGENGLLVPPDDAQALAEAMLRILADGTQAARMGQAGRARFEQHFTLDAMVKKYEGLYADCLRLEA